MQFRYTLHVSFVGNSWDEQGEQLRIHITYIIDCSATYQIRFYISISYDNYNIVKCLSFGVYIQLMYHACNLKQVTQCTVLISVGKTLIATYHSNCYFNQCPPLHAHSNAHCYMNISHVANRIQQEFLIMSALSQSHHVYTSKYNNISAVIAHACFV